MIIANLATYPPRRSSLLPVVLAIAPQVDRLHVVLNEYGSVPEDFPRLGNVVAIIPDEDLKDAGKFYPDTSDADWVILVDDDLVYPPDYVSSSIASVEALGPGRYLSGYHGTIYVKPKLRPSLRKLRRYLNYSVDRTLEHRRVFEFTRGLDASVIVDQIGTGTAVLRRVDMPPFGYMRGAQRFVDVRLARWCFEHGIQSVCLPRPEGWLGQRPFAERIYDFTRQSPPHVAREAAVFAFNNPRRGQTLASVYGRP